MIFYNLFHCFQSSSFLCLFSTLSLVAILSVSHLIQSFPIRKTNSDLLDRLISFRNQSSINSTMLLITKSGKLILIQDVYEIPDLRSEAFYSEVDPVVGGYVFGLWLFYSEPDYNWDSDSHKPIPNSMVKSLFSTDRSKLYTFGMRILSLRTAADSVPFVQNSFTVFLGPKFTGPSDIEIDTNYANMPYSKPKSLIVTGPSTWYVYTATNFVQKTLCIVPTNSHILIPEFYAQQITKMLRHFNSAHVDECQVQFMNNTRTGEVSARIVNVELVSGQNVHIRRIPPIFMRAKDDENELVDY